MITPTIFANGTSAFQHPEFAGIRHGFFTTHGGVSKGVYKSLNAGYGSKDDQASIEENRIRAMHGLQLDPEGLCGLYQYHSNEVITYLEDEIPHFRPKADGLVTSRRDISLAILTADCAPILLYDSTAQVIGACHAGWRGAVSGIIQNTVSHMCQRGAQTMHIKMVIGPTIQQQSYQVGNDMRLEALDNASFSSAQDCFIPDRTAPGKWLFDLPAFCKHAGRMAGIEQIHDIAIDTYAEARSESATCFSHRYATHQSLSETGRLISIISLQTQI